jgi:hypothetical protein
MRLHAGQSEGLVLQTRNDALSLDSGEVRWSSLQRPRLLRLMLTL